MAMAPAGNIAKPSNKAMRPRIERNESARGHSPDRRSPGAFTR
jgi:hypothetical protein